MENRRENPCRISPNRAILDGMTMESATAKMACRLCGGYDLRLHYTQGNRDEFRFYRCAACGLVNYDLSGGLDQGKYEQDLPDPRDAAPRKNRAQTATYCFLSRHLHPPGRLLEIGSGNGRLLHLARQDGWDVAGVELSPVLAERAGRQLGIDVATANVFEPGLGDRLGAGRFDAIVLRHVLEHLPDPLAAMAIFRTLLAPGGHVLLEFPNIDGIDFRVKRWLHRTGLHRRRWPSDYRPGHCNEYDLPSFRHLADRTGFDLRAWETYSSGPVRNQLLRHWPVGTKARALIRKK